MEKIAIKVISPEHGAKVIKYLESLGGKNPAILKGFNVGSYYFIDNGYIRRLKKIQEGYTEAFLPEAEPAKPLDNFRAKAALICLSFYDVEDEERFVKAVLDADELIKELNK